MSANDKAAATYHGADLPIGTPVTYWRGFREGPGVPSVTRSNVWQLGGVDVVLVRGCAGGIALTHVERRVAVDDDPELAREQALRDHVSDLLGDVDHFKGCISFTHPTPGGCTCLLGRLTWAIEAEITETKPDGAA